MFLIKNNARKVKIHIFFNYIFSQDPIPIRTLNKDKEK